MEVRVRSIGPLQQILGGAKLDVTVRTGATIRDLLDQLAEENGEEFAVHVREPKEPVAYAPLRVVLNGRDLLPKQYRESLLTEADDVLIFTPIAGG